VANRDRLTGLDSSFLHLEDSGPAHMHVAACMVLQGPPPEHRELVEALCSRLHLVPRYRQRLAFVPLAQGRPVWVDDPHFNAEFHVRHTALPAPGEEAQLSRLAGRVFSQALDRSRPLWEIWLVEGLARGRFALLSKTHHALVDGVSGVDVLSVLLDASADPAPVAPPRGQWIPRPPPSPAQLLAEALIERATVPGEIARGARAALRGPQALRRGAAAALAGLGALAGVGLRPAAASPYNVRIGPHRRFAWVSAELAQFKQVKGALGATVNDVVLAAVAGALRRHLAARGHDTDGMSLRAMVPVSVRADVERGALGNRVAAIWVPLPVGEPDPVARVAAISAATAQLKASGQAVGAQVLTALSGFAPPTIVAQAARLQARQRFFNLVVTNVPGPQLPLYLLGRELEAIYPMVPLAENTALGVAVMSYNGLIHFGLVGDYDALADLDALAANLREAIAELVDAARDVDPAPRPRRARDTAAKLAQAPAASNGARDPAGRLS
jgi:diacylglycerol O-acyltransferase